MPQSRRGEKDESQREKELGWKIQRREKGKWVLVCPNCFSQLLRPLPTASGILEIARYQCRKCDYIGIAIEVDRQDLDEIQQKQRAQSIAKDSN